MDFDELYRQSKRRAKWRLVSQFSSFIITAVVVAWVSFNDLNLPFQTSLLLPAAPLLFALINVTMPQFASKFTRANLTQEANLNSARFTLSNELQILENERVELVKTMRKSKFSSLPVAVLFGAAAWYFWDVVAGTIVGCMAYFIADEFLTADKKRQFVANFKEKLIKAIVNERGLKFDAARGLSLNEFFKIYDCKVNKSSSEDLVWGKFEGVSVKFSDFYAAHERQTKNGTKTSVKFEGVLFVADFHKSLNCVVQVRHKSSSNLRRYGQKANMDDVRFEELFDVFASDQIGARYALTPLLMQRLVEIYLRLNSPVNVVLEGDKIYIAIETWRDNFEPDFARSLADDATLAFYENEIARLIDIVEELNLNRKIWK